MAREGRPAASRSAANAAGTPRERRRSATPSSRSHGVNLLVISALFGALWGTIARERKLLKPGISETEVRAVLRAATPRIGFYVGATAVAIVAPRVAAVGYLAIAVLVVLRARRDEVPTQGS